MRFEFFVASRYLRAKRRQVEVLSGRERNRGPRHARFSRDGVGSGSPLPKSRAKRGT